MTFGGLRELKVGFKEGDNVGRDVGLFVIPRTVGADVTGHLDGNDVDVETGDREGIPDGIKDGREEGSELGCEEGTVDG